MKRKRRYTAIAVAVGVLMGATAIATPASAQSKSPVNVAFVGDLTGNPLLVTVWKTVQLGVDTAVHRINEAGGIDGHPIKVTAYDAQATPSGATEQFRQIANSNPTAIFGAVFGANMGPAIPIVTALKTPFFWTSRLISGIDKLPYVWGTITGTATNAKVLTQVLKTKLGGSLKDKVIAIEGLTPSPSTDEQIALFKAALKKEGGRLGRTFLDPSNVSSWSSQAANLMAQNPDALVVLHAEPGGLAVGKALGVAGYKGLILLDTSSSTDLVMSTVNLPNAYGIRVVKPVPLGSPIYLQARAAKAGAPTRAVTNPSYFASGYQTVYTFAAALKKCGIPCPKEKLVAQINSIGPVVAPDSPLLRPLDYSVSPSGPNFGQLWQWDPVAKKSVPRGDVIVAK